MTDLTTLFSSIAAAIRNKTGSADKIKASDFPSAIDAIDNTATFNFDGTATAADISEGKTAYTNGPEKVTGTAKIATTLGSNMSLGMSSDSTSDLLFSSQGVTSNVDVVISCSTEDIQEKDFSGMLFIDESYKLVFYLISKKSSSSQHVYHRATIFNYGPSDTTIHYSAYQLVNPKILN